jgi:hypothetical protein
MGLGMGLGIRTLHRAVLQTGVWEMDYAYMKAIGGLACVLLKSDCLTN